MRYQGYWIEAVIQNYLCLSPYAHTSLTISREPQFIAFLKGAWNLYIFISISHTQVAFVVSHETLNISENHMPILSGDICIMVMGQNK